MEKFIHFLKNYLGFTKRESRGFVMVIPVLFLLYLLPKIYEYFLFKNNELTYQYYMDKVDSLRAIVDLPNPSETKAKSKKEYRQDTTIKQMPKNNAYKVNINKIDFSDADSVTLQIVPGIGPTLSSRIIKYRENLGGVIQKEQLLEVYGLSPEVLDKVFEFFEFNPYIKRKININEVEVSDLSRHPYVNNGLAKVIVAYRKQHGNFETQEDLLKIKIIQQEWIEKMAPYLSF